MKNKFALLLSFLTVLSFSIYSFGQEKQLTIQKLTEDLDGYFTKTILEQGFVGLGACLIKDNKIQWMNTYGYADREEKKPLQKNNIFQIASLSKVFTATAIMQVYEKGLFSLDDDVNDYLPFKVRNPNFPDKPITFRMLLTHTSSFDDLLPAGNKILRGVKGDHPIKLSEYVTELFTPDGKYYSIDYFSKTYAPGDKYSYSNISFSLLGYLVESIMKQDFSEYCKKNIFEPLNMKNTGWHLKDLDVNNIAVCYGITGNDTSVFKRVDHFGVPGYPEGMLRTTLEDLSHFILAYLNDGKYNDYQLLKSETLKLMLSPEGIKNIPTRSFPVEDIGLTWLKVNIDGHPYYTMNGFSGSIFTIAAFSLEYKTAMIYFFTGISMQNMLKSNQMTSKLVKAINELKVE
ncbi:MAG TPA: serine hydrolase domain-containing protein [Ignavibacteriaceae bacterium]|nr:serine hydrolase domain-containing protein [Ignavibacteriaceae bacterium]